LHWIKLQSVTNNQRDLRLDLVISGSFTKAARFNASSGANVNFNGSFFQSGHHDGFHGADLSLGFGMAVWKLSKSLRLRNQLAE
jgi:hypothetical protein